MLYSEFDSQAAAWLRELMKDGLIPEGIVDERNIRELQPADLAGHGTVHLFAGIGGWPYALRLAGWPDDRPVWTGSCPCQPFSAAGKRKGESDERHLWPEMFRLIRECRPDVCFGEQVASPDGFAWLDLVSADLEGMGYAVGAVVTPAAGYGAPHARHRIYWVAESSGVRRHPRQQPGAVHERDESGRPGTGNGRAAGELANANGRKLSDRELQRGGQHGLQPQGRGAAGVAQGNANSAGPQERPEPEVERGPLRIEGSTLGEADPLRGFWRGADWLYCRDGKYRSAEPGSFPLAHGVPARMGRLRGYGNALCIPQATAFVRAFMETLAAIETTPGAGSRREVRRDTSR